MLMAFHIHKLTNVFCVGSFISAHSVKQMCVIEYLLVCR